MHKCYGCGNELTDDEVQSELEQARKDQPDVDPTPEDLSLWCAVCIAREGFE
jgi:hypothetical protein